MPGLQTSTNTTTGIWIKISSAATHAANSE
jgi:hypothetical protein